MTNPFDKTPQPVCFSRGVTNLGQTFVTEKKIKLSRLTLYAGDGIGTSPTNTVTLALYDLGAAGTNDSSGSYLATTDLFGSGKGLRFAYTPQGPGLLNLDFGPNEQVVLQAGHRYSLELHGVKNSCPMCWYGSQYDYGYHDVYAGGAAYRDRKLVKNREGVTADFGFAIYGAREN